MSWGNTFFILILITVWFSKCHVKLANKEQELDETYIYN